MNIKDALKYEIASSFWAPFISCEWGHDLAGKYFVWKTKRKYKRFLYISDLYKQRGKELINEV